VHVPNLKAIILRPAAGSVKGFQVEHGQKSGQEVAVRSMMVCAHSAVVSTLLVRRQRCRSILC
jgi:hypothetical protein